MHKRCLDIHPRRSPHEDLDISHRASVLSERSSNTIIPPCFLQLHAIMLDLDVSSARRTPLIEFLQRVSRSGKEIPATRKPRRYPDDSREQDATKQALPYRGIRVLRGSILMYLPCTVHAVKGGLMSILPHGPHRRCPSKVESREFTDRREMQDKKCGERMNWQNHMSSRLL